MGNRDMFDFLKSKENDRATMSIPLLPLRDVVVFPHMIVPLFVGREKSIAALESAMKNEKGILRPYPTLRIFLPLILLIMLLLLRALGLSAIKRTSE